MHMDPTAELKDVRSKQSVLHCLRVSFVRLASEIQNYSREITELTFVLCTVKMKLLSLIFWQVLLLGLTVQPSEEVEAVCTGTTCYTLHLGKHSWMEAQQKCENNGGNLMTLKRREEALLVQQLLDKMPKGAPAQGGKVRMWIGLHREKGKCYQKHQLLKGFSWITGGEDTEYANWEPEPRATCTAMRCVALQHTPSSVQGLAWVDSHCSSLTADGETGYLCKFSFQGMCRPLVLAGPGTVQYKTPFGVSTSSLAAVPFGSIADVACDAQGGKVTNAFLVCKPHPKSNTSEWSSPGPFCASPTYGCSYNKGGCEHACLDMSGGSFQCTCPSGYQLGSDNLSCNPVNYCSSNPCQGQCLTRPDGFECTCPLGYALASDGLNCVDVDECSSPQNPCEQVCVNTMGSFTCFCQKGYKAAGRKCEDIDECSTGMPCEQLCVNTHGSFLCSCNLGYQLEGVNSSSCLDVDECDEEPCEHMCTNSVGSYQCSCRAGWTLAPNKISCIQDSADKRPSQSTQGDAELSASTTTHPTSETPDISSNSSVQSELETLFMSQAFTLHPGVLSSPLDAEGQDSEGNVDKNSANSRELLYYILGGMLVLLLMVCAFSLVTYRKMKAKKARKKSASAADHYSWVPEQGETRA